MNSEPVVQAVGGPAKTVVFKGISSHGAVWDPWRDAHRRYFDLLFRRLSAQHVIILAGEREILDLSTEESRRAFGRGEPRVEYVPDAPRQLEAECGASLYFVADPDSIVPPELKQHYAVVMHCDGCRELRGRRLVNVTASLFLPERAI